MPEWPRIEPCVKRPRPITRALGSPRARRWCGTSPLRKPLNATQAPFYRWFEDGQLNASANCLDRHMGTEVENKTAIIFESDDGQVTRVTYRELLERVAQFANALKAMGVQRAIVWWCTCP